ncbi:Cdc7p-Dbf4p kinase complex regulatory subunit, partial [Spiromyces aspiralis]
MTTPRRVSTLQLPKSLKHRDLLGLTSPTPPTIASATSRRRMPLSIISNKDVMRGNISAHGPTTSALTATSCTASATATAAAAITPSATATPTITTTPAATATATKAATSHSLATIKDRQQREMKLNEWIMNYRRAFPTFVFYFDNLSPDVAQKLKMQILALGGSIESFFTTQKVTHVIVADASLIPTDLSNVSDTIRCTPAYVALQQNLRVWDVNKFQNRILRFILPQYNDFIREPTNPAIASATTSLGKRKLEDMLSMEKAALTYSLGYADNLATILNQQEFIYLRHYYVLVEDSSHLHRPVIVEDYRQPPPGQDPPWPKLYAVPRGRCPFAPCEVPTSSKRGEGSSDSNNCSGDSNERNSGIAETRDE